MAAEGVENFQAIMVSLAAVAGSAIAGMSLWTWKQQIRWQQGRGLAVNTLQAFFVFKRVALDVQKQAFFSFDETKTQEEGIVLAKLAWDRATEYCSKLEEAHMALEKQIAEAMVVWGNDFGEFVSEISDVQHIARSAVLSGAASVDPLRKRSERDQSAHLYEAFKSDVYGYNNERISLGDRLASGQKLLLEILHSKRLA